MTKGKTRNMELRKDVIIELAIANDYKSIPELSILTKIIFETIDNFFKENDLSKLIEYKSKDRFTATGIRLTKLYKLKNDIDNLLAVFKYLDDKKYQKSLMDTDYYKSLIPEIESKLSGHIEYIPNKNEITLELRNENNVPFYINHTMPINKSKEICLNKLLNVSPSATLYLIESIKEMEVNFPKYCIHLHELDRFVLNDISERIINGSEYQNDEEGGL